MAVLEGGGTQPAGTFPTTEEEVRAALSRLGYQVVAVNFVDNPAYTATNDEPRQIPAVTVAGEGGTSAARAISDAIGGGTVSFTDRQTTQPDGPSEQFNQFNPELHDGDTTGTTSDGGGGGGGVIGGGGPTASGGGGGGGGAPAGGASSEPRNPVDVPEEQLEETVRQLYGYLAVFLDHPELGPIIKQAAREGWSQERIKGAVSETEWWQTTGQTARQWEVLKSEDPATARQRLSTRIEQLTESAQRFGAQVDPETVEGLAETSIRLGWDEDQIDEALLNEARKFGAGQVRFTAEQLRAAAVGDYMVPMSEQAAQDWATRIAKGEATADGFTSYLREQAASMFDGNQSIQRALERGQTVRQWANPYIQMTAETLELNPQEVDFRKPKFRRMIHQVTDDGSSPMSLADAQRYLRGLPDWKGTRQATEQSAELTEQLARRMGVA